VESPLLTLGDAALVLKWCRGGCPRWTAAARHKCVIHGSV